ADKIAPAIDTPALVGTDTTNAERALCVISFPCSVCELMRSLGISGSPARIANATFVTQKGIFTHTSENGYLNDILASRKILPLDLAPNNMAIIFKDDGQISERWTTAAVKSVHHAAHIVEYRRSIVWWRTKQRNIQRDRTENQARPATAVI